MDLANNTVLITGGSSGIGFALALRFARAGSKVIVCGRRKDQLEWAAANCPGLVTIQCDVSSESERISLFSWVIREFPSLNVLINNAGIQNRLSSLNDLQNWERQKQEIAINLEAPLHFSGLFIPHLSSQKSSAIINISSGLAFLPLSFMPTYCATKAAIHSFTQSLRHQLKTTSIKVIEVIPPAVNTDLGGKGLHDDGTPLDEFADHALASIQKGDLEFGYGFSEKARLASRDLLNGMFASMNK